MQSSVSDPLGGEFYHEAELILRCVRPHVNRDTADQIEPLAGGELNWEYIIDVTRRHGLVPLHYRTLIAPCPARVPTAALEIIRKRYRLNLARNRVVAHELVQILKLFDAEGIVALPYKGVPLAVCAYDDISLREFCDHDMLLRKADIARAKQLLMDCGYRAVRSLTERLDLDYREEYEYTLQHENRWASVELQWDIVERKFAFAFDIVRLWEHRVVVELPGARKVFTLAPQDLVLILCVHGAKHCWSQLKWVCDVAGLVRRFSDSDWSYVDNEASRFGIRRMLYLGLYLTDKLLAVKLPDPICRSIQADTEIAHLAASVSARAFATAPRQLDTILSPTLFHLRTREHLRDRLRYCLWAAARKLEDCARVSLRPIVRLFYNRLPSLLGYGRAVAEQRGTFKQ